MGGDGGLADLEELGEVAGAGFGLTAQVPHDSQPDRVAESAEDQGLPTKLLLHWLKDST